jgi:hypothetical protein
MNEQKTASSDSLAPAPMGLEHAGVIDFIGFHSASGEVVAVMVEKRPWNQPDLQLFQLQEKLNAYLSFVLDGEMQEVYPQFVGKPLRIRLECVTAPGPEFARFLQIVRDQVALQGIAFEVLVTATAPVGGAGTCGCGQPSGGCSSPAE